jgi:DNA-binding transcriptional LysR family regulator
VLADLGLSIGGSQWLFTPELKSRAVIAVLQDWSLPAMDLWALFPTGRQVSAKARAFTSFIERQLAGEEVAQKVN